MKRMIFVSLMGLSCLPLSGCRLVNAWVKKEKARQDAFRKEWAGRGEQEQNLHLAYVDRAHKAVRASTDPSAAAGIVPSEARTEPSAGGSALASASQAPDLAGARVAFTNDTGQVVRVQVRDTRGRDPQQWEFIMKPGQTIVFPDDDRKAPLFQYNGTYTVTSRRKDWSNGRVNTGAFHVLPAATKYLSEQGIYYAGGATLDWVY